MLLSSGVRAYPDTPPRFRLVFSSKQPIMFQLATLASEKMLDVSLPC